MIIKNVWIVSAGLISITIVGMITNHLEIAAVAVGIVAILLYMLNLKQKKLNAYEAQIRLVETKEQADALEHEINTLKEKRGTTKEKLDELGEALIQLKDKKAELKKKADDRTPQEVEDHWNK